MPQPAPRDMAQTPGHGLYLASSAQHLQVRICPFPVALSLVHLPSDRLLLLLFLPCPLPLTPDSVTAECLNLSIAEAGLELSRRRYQWQEIQAPLAFSGTALGYRLVSLPAPLPLCGRTVSCGCSFGGRQSLFLPLVSSEHLWAMAPFPAQALAKEPISWGISGHPLLMAPPHGGS